MPRIASAVSALLAFVALNIGVASPARAQSCNPAWQFFEVATAGNPGVDGTVKATTMWAPDGAGPQTPKLVVGGLFTMARNVTASNIAAFNPSTGEWSPLGSGLNDTVEALAVLPSGDLVAAGRFTLSGFTSVSRIARWNGSTWSPLGSGISGSLPPPNDAPPVVYALTVMPNGDLVAGGLFTAAGGVSASNIARWNGSAWSALGSGLNNNARALTVRSNGYVVAGGDFSSAGGVSANRIAQWDGTAWSNIGSGMDIAVYALAVPPSGDLVAGGWFNTVSGVSAKNIARGVLPASPSIVSQPENATAPANEHLYLDVDLAPGADDISVRWQRNGVDVLNGAGGAGQGGGTVEFGSGTLSGGIRNFSLRIRYARPVDAGTYTVVLSNGLLQRHHQPSHRHHHARRVPGGPRSKRRRGHQRPPLLPRTLREHRERSKLAPVAVRLQLRPGGEHPRPRLLPRTVRLVVPVMPIPSCEHCVAG